MSEIRGPVDLIGIGGVHMSAIGLLLLEKGIAVSGSDLERSPMTDRLAARGARIAIGHAAENVGDAALVVTTAAAAEDNSEIIEAARRGIDVILRAEMVARLMEGKRVIAVAGSHGKTTTSSLIAHILVQAGRKPMYLLGGECIDLGGHASWGEGDLCVVEADEYKRAFLEYRPAVAVVTNIEADHLDYYGTEAAYHEAFIAFGRRVGRDGTLFVCGDDPGARAMADAVSGGSATVERYGLDAGNAWRAVAIDEGEQSTTFRVERGGEGLGTLETGLPGVHGVRDVLAATAVCTGEGVPFAETAEAVRAFRGARRRFETVGEAGGVLVIDDYAHHPTEVRVNLAAARKRFPGRRIIGVHQPHTYSRIAYLWDEWVSCWDGLDALIILETYAAREQPLEGRSAEGHLAAAIHEPKARYAPDFEAAADTAAALARPGDIILTIGAGDVFRVGPMVLERLS